ncbi:hypothetical protein F8S13_11610 [Chloroflexia bacterium SDU3-3]|nr:hypothetical protein F8S13_11610 [Chloroflexia bacterium SDU3-3]
MNNEVIAGHRVLLCPRCGGAVREDLVAEHEKRCPDKQQVFIPRPPAVSPPKRPQSPPQVQQPPQRGARAKRPPRNPLEGRDACPQCGMVVPAVHLRAHVERCHHKKKPTAAQPDVQERQRQTQEGYEISKCWSCGRRICLVPRNATMVTHEVGPHGAVGDVHLCDGINSGGRRSSLIYVDRRAAQVAPNTDPPSDTPKKRRKG